MAVSVVGYASSAGFVTSLAVNKSAVDASLGGTVTDGDVLIAALHTDWGVLPTVPGGWATEVIANPGGNAPHVHVMSRTAASEGASWTFSTTTGATPDSTLTVVCLRDATVTGAVGSASTNTSTINGSTLTAPSVDHAGSAGSLLLCGAWLEDNSARTFTPPTGMTEIADLQSTTWTATGIAYLASPADPSGTRDFTLSGAAANASGGVWSLVVEPTAAPPAGDPLRLPIQTIRVP